MKTNHSPDTMHHSAITYKQRWLYWNVPEYFAATWIRHAKEQFSSDNKSISESFVWEEIVWSPNVNFDIEKMESQNRIRQATCFLIGIESDNPIPMFGHIAKIKNYLTNNSGYQIKDKIAEHSKTFLVVQCFDASLDLKKSLLEVGADFVIDNLTLVPSVSRRIVSVGTSFPIPQHSSLARTTVNS